MYIVFVITLDFFGNFCFYVSQNQLNPRRKRNLVNNQEFICEVYKLMGYDES